MNATITDQDIAYQVSTSLDGFIDDYNIDDIVRDIIDTYGRVNIDDIDSDEYWAIVERHDTTITVWEDNAGGVALSRGDEIWHLGSIPAYQTVNATEHCAAWNAGKWTPAQEHRDDPNNGLTRLDTTDGMTLIATYQHGAMDIVTEGDNESVAGSGGRSFLGIDQD